MQAPSVTHAATPAYTCSLTLTYRQCSAAKESHPSMESFLLKLMICFWPTLEVQKSRREERSEIPHHWLALSRLILMLDIMLRPLIQVLLVSSIIRVQITLICKLKFLKIIVKRNLIEGHDGKREILLENPKEISIHTSIPYS